jgi:hypothetical protein
MFTDILKFFDVQEVRENPEDQLQNDSIEFKIKQQKKNLKILTFKIKAILSWVKHKKCKFRSLS